MQPLIPRKISVTVYIAPDQLDALDQLSAMTKIPKAVLIREGIELMLKARTLQLVKENT